MPSKRTLLFCILLAALAAVGVGLVWMNAPPALPPITLRITHLQFKEFSQEILVVQGQVTPIWDTEYGVRLLGFLPDFYLDMKTRRVGTRSNELKNPAVRLEVVKAGKHAYDLWVVKNEPEKHRVPAPGFVFEIAKVGGP